MKLTHNLSKNNHGFTLVELLVVVAIIGILVSVGVPNYKKYKAKAKASEAKLQLGSVHTAETSFQSNYDTFATCLTHMGYDPSGEKSQRYYAVGFKTKHADAVSTQVEQAGLAACKDDSLEATGQFEAGRKAGAKEPATKDMITGSFKAIQLTATPTTFTSGAVGIISPDDAEGDQWTINEKKELKHVKIGY